MQKLLVILVVLLSGCVTNQTKDTIKAEDKSYQTFNYEIPDAMSKQIRDTLSRYQGNILSSELVGSINLDNLAAGSIYEFQSTSADKLVFSYVKNEAGFAYFDLVTHLDGEAYPAIFRTNGIVSEVAKPKNPNKYSEYLPGENTCKFVIGECEYKVGSKRRKVSTSFENGVWTTTLPMGRFGVGYLVVKKIYDQNGIMLYRGTFSNQWADGKHSYTIRSN